MWPRSMMIIMYVNIPLLIRSLQDQTKIMDEELLSDVSLNRSVIQEPTVPFMLGLKQRKVKAIRNKKSKWYTSWELYSDRIYPDYLSGPTYAMSGPAALKLYQASLRVPIFWLEDVYITGMCALVANIPLIKDTRFSDIKTPLYGLAFRDRISAHGFTVPEIKIIHRQLYLYSTPVKS